MERNREVRLQKKPRVLAAAGADGGDLVSTAHPLFCTCLPFISVYTRRTRVGTLESHRHTCCKLACASQAVVLPAADVDAEADKEAALALDVKAIQAPLIFHSIAMMSARRARRARRVTTSYTVSLCSGV